MNFFEFFEWRITYWNMWGYCSNYLFEQYPHMLRSLWNHTSITIELNNTLLSYCHLNNHYDINDTTHYHTCNDFDINENTPLWNQWQNFLNNIPLHHWWKPSKTKKNYRTTHLVEIILYFTAKLLPLSLYCSTLMVLLLLSPFHTNEKNDTLPDWVHLLGICNAPPFTVIPSLILWNYPPYRYDSSSYAESLFLYFSPLDCD